MCPQIWIFHIYLFTYLPILGSGVEVITLAIADPTLAATLCLLLTGWLCDVLEY